MGQTLSEPVTSKVSSTQANSALKCGCSCMQGWRISMEDAHTVALDVFHREPATATANHQLEQPDEDSVDLPGGGGGGGSGGQGSTSTSNSPLSSSFSFQNSTHFLAVFDGHGGRRIADFASKTLHHRLTQSSLFKSGSVVEALRQSYLELDQEMMTSDEFHNELAGTTAISTLLYDNKIICANVGDSRAVLCVSGHAVALSHDHKPQAPEEHSRIVSAGGWVEFGRVNGNLALSRALGDFNFKRNKSKPAEEQIVTALPELSLYDISEKIEFLVIACDGIWDVLTNSEVVEFCRKRIVMQVEPVKICEELMDQCLAPDCHMGGLGCDNMTVLLACFLHGQTYASLAHKCSQAPSQAVPSQPTFL